MFGNSARSLPVLMYHYVSPQENSIAVAPELFEEHCRALAAGGKRGVSLAEAEAFLRDGKSLSRGAVLITFDDGYLDNYLHALPSLARHGHKGVVFAVSNRLEPGETPRIVLEDVLAGRAGAPERVDHPVGRDELGYEVRRDVFCNHAEVRAMEASGILAVASHGRGHYGVYAGPEYTDFIRPGRQVRTFYRTEEPRLWGLPNFKVIAGLQNRAFVLSTDLLRAVGDLVPQAYADADAFFKHPESLERLRQVVAALAAKPEGLGRMESDAERQERMRREIAGGKAELEAVLGKTVNSLCWPWGRYAPEAHALALQAGFSVLFTTREGANLPGRPLTVHRFKAKSQNGAWLLSRVRLYERPLFGALYAKIRI